MLRDEVGRCSALLAIIGDKWLDLRDEHGQRRLESETDFVRVEIATALDRGIPVIPVLIDGTTIPPTELLPTNIEELARRHALQVHYVSFHHDIEKLVAHLERRFSEHFQSKRGGLKRATAYFRTVVAWIAATVVAIFIGWYAYQSFNELMKFASCRRTPTAGARSIIRKHSTRGTGATEGTDAARGTCSRGADCFTKRAGALGTGSSTRSTSTAGRIGSARRTGSAGRVGVEGRTSTIRGRKSPSNASARKTPSGPHLRRSCRNMNDR